MAIFRRTILLAVMIVAATGASAYAMSDSGGAKKGADPVVILSTVSNRTTDTLTIRGAGFGQRPAEVWCQDYLLTVESWTDSEIVAFLPDALVDGSYLLTIVRGDGQKDRDVFDMTLQGESTSAGPKGDPGDPGPRGDKGDVGPTGQTGPAGPKGDTGAAGPKGDTGAAGPKGDTGAAGLKGDTGAIGPRGEPGPQGEAGAAGPQGLAGVAGPQGERGLAGAQGEAGAIGPQGPAGPQGQAGPQGVAGAQGPAGVQGPLGPIGPAGPQGAAGVSGLEVIVSALTTVSINGNQTTTLMAACPAGKVAIGGGFDYSGNVAPVTPVASFPAAADTWRVMIRLSQIGAATFQGRAYAICAAAR
jgi:hypothetical protein